ncbi:hypothetical protein [Enterobacter cloacae complex sp. CARB60]|uniref:hypothetical protein n=1 Tax=Enterobacter cloacae complex sp. CARB60 TaxID=3119569 RepID=UPI002F41E3BE
MTTHSEKQPGFFSPTSGSEMKRRCGIPFFVNDNNVRKLKNVAHLKSKIGYFWGSMDLLAILLYCVNSVRHDRIPFISDAKAFSASLHYYTDDGFSILVMLFFVLDLLLLLSLFASAWVFFKRKNGAVKFALAQELFRLISFRCSVSFFPLLVSMFDVSNIWLNVGLFVTSETLKIYSLVFWMNKREKPLS